jgi:hypothetical protein
VVNFGFCFFFFISVHQGHIFNGKCMERIVAEYVLLRTGVILQLVVWINPIKS